MLSRRSAAMTAWASFALGVLLTSLVSIGDWWEPLRTWLTSHPYSKEAATGLIGLIVTVWLIAIWLGWREAARLKRVVVVAYRSFAQTVNDCGRRLLAPLNGGDIAALGVPGGATEEVIAARAWLRAHGLSDVGLDDQGRMRAPDSDAKTALQLAVQERPMAQHLFLLVSRSRREMQEATATWAPAFMAAKGDAFNTFAQVQDFTDLLELVQERLRLVGLSTAAEPTRDAQQAAELYWYAIQVYVEIIAKLRPLAELPSDVPGRAHSLSEKAKRVWSTGQTG